MNHVPLICLFCMLLSIQFGWDYGVTIFAFGGFIVGSSLIIVEIFQLVRSLRSLAVYAPPTDEVDRIYEEFWKPLVEKDGKLDMGLLKRELADYHEVLERVPGVYCYVTGGQVSKILTDPEIVKALTDEHYSRLVEDELN